MDDDDFKEQSPDCPSTFGIAGRWDTTGDGVGVSVDPRVMALYTDVTELVGIEEKQKELINMLLDGDDWSMHPLKTVSIVGFGGLGKTTLAKTVYDSIKVQFDCAAFVSVSDNPDTKKVFKNILYELDKKKYANIQSATWEEKHLIDEIIEFLTDKRYVIVLDDIWDAKAWQLIECAFWKKSAGCRLITTTRIISVSEACCSSSEDIYRMRPLSHKESRRLFNKRVFSHEMGCPPELMEVSEGILKTCGGIPLAVITIASILAINRQIKGKDQWYVLLNSIGRGLTKNPNVAMRNILLFSYYDLPSYLKPCLLYISVYTEDHKIMRRKLVWEWISEGFVSSEKQETNLYELGDSYFNELVNRCMIQPIGVDNEEKVEACRVHDMVLDLICSLASEDNLDGSGTHRKMPSPQSKTRRLSVQNSKGKMEDRNSLWLPALETDIPITAWIDLVMEGPGTASLGPMAPLLRQVHSLLAMAPEHIQGGSEDDVKRLKEHLEVLCRDLLQPEETSSTPKWWRKEVRELLYDTQDRLDEVIIFQAGDFSELIAGVEDACERRKRLQLPPNKTTKRDLGEAGLSYFTPPKTSVELSKPIFVPGHYAGLGVVGVEDPMKKLVEQLAFDDDKQKRLKVIPIVGFPGVGKTTAAGILYYKYRGKFQCSAFVRVSRTPDTRSLLLSILSQIKAPGLCGFPDVHDLIDGIRKHLKDKRYFIIMDDLWTASIWDIISRAFPDVDYGSRIITTTQIDDVALACCRYHPDYIEMSPLNYDQSKELFFTIVFGSEDHCPPDFKKLSCKIINKCAGLPLVIVCIASLLASESYLVVEKWEHIQDSLPCTRTNPTSEGVKGLSSDTAIGSGGRMLARGPTIDNWKRTQDSLPFISEGLKQVLNLVYNNLPPHLKACLLYLCMYPEGYHVRKHDLVRQWVAEGFINAMGGRGAEEIGGVYFDELVSRGMLQPAATNYGKEVLSCTIHHMVLDLIRQKCNELNFIITVDNLQSTLALPDEVRRLSVQFGGSKGADVPENILISKVRSLLFWGFIDCVPSVVDYALLRVLILHIWADGEETSFDLTSISELLLLRYLKIQCNIMVNLPDEIKGLKCLETLEVDARLSAVPGDIGHLKKLLHLLLPSEAILPKGLDGLTSLLTLGCFDLSKNSTQNVIDLAELTNLQDVHLTCSTEPPELPVGSMEYLGSILEKFNDLRSLSLRGAGSSSQIISDDGLSIVSPSPALLEKLELLPRICTLSRLPKWIGELSRLSILKIEVLDLSIDDIAILKDLASLASLSLYVRTEHAEWIIFDNKGFPALKYFKFVRTLPYMSFLEGAMPNVQKLKLAFDANRLKPEYSLGTFGFQHMTGLTQISLKFGGTGADDSNKRDAERVWKDAFTNHPNNPILDARWVDCIFNGDKTTDVEDAKGHDRRASTSSDTIEAVGQIFKKARLH